MLSLTGIGFDAHYHAPSKTVGSSMNTESAPVAAILTAGARKRCFRCGHKLTRSLTKRLLASTEPLCGCTPEDKAEFICSLSGAAPEVALSPLLAEEEECCIGPRRLREEDVKCDAQVSASSMVRSIRRGKFVAAIFELFNASILRIYKKAFSWWQHETVHVVCPVDYKDAKGCEHRGMLLQLPNFSVWSEKTGNLGEKSSYVVATDLSKSFIIDYSCEKSSWIDKFKGINAVNPLPRAFAQFLLQEFEKRSDAIERAEIYAFGDSETGLLPITAANIAETCSNFLPGTDFSLFMERFLNVLLDPKAVNICYIVMTDGDDPNVTKYIKRHSPRFHAALKANQHKTIRLVFVVYECAGKIDVRVEVLRKLADLLGASNTSTFVFIPKINTIHYFEEEKKVAAFDDMARGIFARSKSITVFPAGFVPVADVCAGLFYPEGTFRNALQVNKQTSLNYFRWKVGLDFKNDAALCPSPILEVTVPADMALLSVCVKSTLLPALSSGNMHDSIPLLTDLCDEATQVALRQFTKKFAGQGTGVAVGDMANYRKQLQEQDAFSQLHKRLTDPIPCDGIVRAFKRISLRPLKYVGVGSIWFPFAGELDSNRDVLVPIPDRFDDASVGKFGDLLRLASRSSRDSLLFKALVEPLVALNIPSSCLGLSNVMPGPTTVFFWAVMVFLHTKERAPFTLVDLENLPAESRLLFNGLKDKKSALRLLAMHPTARIIKELYLGNALTSEDFLFVDEFLKSFPEGKRKGKVNLATTDGAFSLDFDVADLSATFKLDGDSMTVTVVDYSFVLKIPQIAGNFKKALDYQFTGVSVNSTDFIGPFLRHDRARKAEELAVALKAAAATGGSGSGLKAPPSDKIIRSLLDELPLVIKQTLHLSLNAAGFVESFHAVSVRLYLDTALELARKALLYRTADDMAACKVLMEVYDKLKPSAASNEGLMMLEVAFYVKAAVERTSVAVDGGFVSLEDAETRMQKALRTRNIHPKSFKLPQNKIHEYLSRNIRLYCETGVNDRLRKVSAASGAH